MAYRFWGLIFSILVGIQSPVFSAFQGKSKERDLTVTPLSEKETAFPTSVPRGYALIIGIGKYKNLDNSHSLQFSESDAEAIHRVLISQEGGAFPSENVHVLIGPQATLSRIREELEVWLPNVAQPPDRVVVYFAGHGLVKDGRGYLPGWDVDIENLEQTAYPMSALGKAMGEGIKARWKVLLIDTCHSGKINAETTNESVDAQFRNLPTDFLTFSATTEREKSYEDPDLSTGFGLFTYFLVQAWKGYADNDPCDGKITADELIEYVRSHVRQYAKERQVNQTPTARGDYEPNMLLGVSRNCLTTHSASPSMTGTAIVEANMDDVDLYVDGSFIGKITKSKPLVIPGLSGGLHTFKGVRTGYEPDTKQIMIAPGQESTVTLRIRYARTIKKSALELGAEGEKYLLTKRSALNPLNVLPVSRSQGIGDLKKARELFIKALEEDNQYSNAAFRLGQVNQLLSDEEGSLKAYRRALEIDPSYVDARLQYSAVLIESGDPDEAIRQITEASRLDPSNDEAYSLLSRAYWDKGSWKLCIDMADKAIALKQSNDMAHLWKGDALRQMGAEEKDPAIWKPLYRQAKEEYKTFLSLTNFSTPAYEWVAFHFIGFGRGSRRHADRKDSYDQLRSSGFLGVCLCDQRLGQPLQAKEYCTRALKYDANDPIAYFVLGNVYRDLFNAALKQGMNRCDYLVSAQENYTKMLRLNTELEESRHAKDYIEQIGEILPALRRKGCSSSADGDRM